MYDAFCPFYSFLEFVYELLIVLAACVEIPNVGELMYASFPLNQSALSNEEWLVFYILLLFSYLVSLHFKSLLAYT